MNLFSAIKNTVDFDGSVFRIIADDSHVRTIERCAGIKRPTRAEPSWRSPALPYNVQQLSQLPLRWSEAAKAQGKELLAEANWRLNASKAIQSDYRIKDFHRELYSYQRAGVEYMVRAKRVLVSDEMGLGKTSESLAVLSVLDSFPALVICPANGKYQWKNEVEACLPDKSVCVLDSKSKLGLVEHDIYIVNYDVLANGWTSPQKKEVKLSNIGEQLLNAPIKAIILDEIHACKNHGAQKTKAVRKLVEGKLIRIGLTGTPVTNRTSELVPIAQILGRLNDLGGWLHFMERYCKSKSKWGEYQGNLNAAELHERMRASFYIRRTKEEVKLELPSSTRSIVPVDIDNWAEYKKAEDELLEWVREKAAKDKSYLESIAHLPDARQQALIAEYQHDKVQRAKRAEAMVRITALKGITGRGKLKAAKQWIDNFLESDQKLVVFAAHKEVLEQLKQWYPNEAYILSSMNAQERQANVESFQNNGTRLCIGAMGTSAGASPAGTGHTLTSSSNILTMELGWTPAHHRQLDARIHRIGQSFPCTSHYLIAANTIERNILTLLDEKAVICDQITDGTSGDNTPPLVDLLIEQLKTQR